MRSSWVSAYSTRTRVTHEAADSWIYHAKDSATGAAVALHLTREACTDATNDTLTTTPRSAGSTVFELRWITRDRLDAGCARIAAELFPKINNQPVRKKKRQEKPPARPSQISRLPLPSPTRICRQRCFRPWHGKEGCGARRAPNWPSRTTVRNSSTRARIQDQPRRTIVLYDLDSGKSLDLLHGLVRQAFWSPDDGASSSSSFWIAPWQVWSFPAGHPESALPFHRSQLMLCTDGWIITPSWRQTC